MIGANILPARVLRPTDKQACERAFGGIRSLLFEYLPGYTGDRGHLYRPLGRRSPPWPAITHRLHVRDGQWRDIVVFFSGVSHGDLAH